MMNKLFKKNVFGYSQHLSRVGVEFKKYCAKMVLNFSNYMRVRILGSEKDCLKQK
jgi:hypothetical protein